MRTWQRPASVAPHRLVVLCSSWLSVTEGVWNFPLPVLAGPQGEERTLYVTFGK